MKDVVTVLHNIKNSGSCGKDFVCNSRLENYLLYLIMPPVILDPSEIKLSLKKFFFICCSF